MTKFKIGDSVRKVNDEFLWRFEIGDNLVVVGIATSTGNAQVAKEEDQEGWDTTYDSDIELINSDVPKTITLTRYIKPATIETNGVEYLMPEKNDAA